MIIQARADRKICTPREGKVIAERVVQIFTPQDEPVGPPALGDEQQIAPIFTSWPIQAMLALYGHQGE